jgi:hypothetical protein
MSHAVLTDIITAGCSRTRRAIIRSEMSSAYSYLETKYIICRNKRMPLDRLCGLEVRVPGYGSRGPASIPGATRFF